MEQAGQPGTKKQFYKFTNKECEHNGFKYQEGLNTDTKPWNTDECSEGGLYIVPIEHWYEWLGYRHDLYYVWDAVPVGPPALISHESGHKTKCHQIELSNRRRISEMEELEAGREIVVMRDGSLISLSAQLVAVQEHELAIKHIQNPSEEVMMTVVQRRPPALAHIRNPSEAVMLAAVRRNGHVIQFIPNPSEAVMLAAVQQNKKALAYIANPPEAVQLAAVKHKRTEGVVAIQFISNPSIEVQLAAVQHNGLAIRDIVHPSVEVQLAAVRQNGLAIQFISNPSVEVPRMVQLAAVQQNGFAIHFIVNPSMEVRLAAGQ